MRDIATDRQNKIKIIKNNHNEKFLEDDENGMYKICNKNCISEGHEITIDQLSYLVKNRISDKKSPPTSEDKGCSFSLMLKVMILLLTLAWMLTGVYEFYKRNFFSGISQSSTFSSNENFKIIDDVSKFKHEKYYGQKQFIDFLIMKFVSMFENFQNLDLESINLKYKPRNKNILLYGPPGTGKTMCIKILSYMLDLEQKLRILVKRNKENNQDADRINWRELNEMKSTVVVILIEPSTLISKFVGETEKNLQRIFKKANDIAKEKTVIIFMDEIENMTKKRGSNVSDHSHNAITEFLSILDGFLTEITSRVIFIGATNIKEMIDDAILRRFVYTIELGLPNEKQRDIFIKSFTSANLFFNSERHDRLIKLSKGMSFDSLDRIFKEVESQCDDDKTSYTYWEIEAEMMKHYKYVDPKNLEAIENTKNERYMLSVEDQDNLLINQYNVGSS